MLANEEAQKKNYGYDVLTEEEKNSVEEALFLLDKFGVGDEFYHELSWRKREGN